MSTTNPTSEEYDRDLFHAAMRDIGREMVGDTSHLTVPQLVEKIAVYLFLKGEVDTLRARVIRWAYPIVHGTGG